jgi:hypothetical protein
LTETVIETAARTVTAAISTLLGTEPCPLLGWRTPEAAEDLLATWTIGPEGWEPDPNDLGIEVHRDARRLLSRKEVPIDPNSPKEVRLCHIDNH